MIKMLNIRFSDIVLVVVIVVTVVTVVPIVVLVVVVDKYSNNPVECICQEFNNTITVTCVQ